MYNQDLALNNLQGLIYHKNYSTIPYEKNETESQFLSGS